MSKAFAPFEGKPLNEVAFMPAAIEMGERLFMNNCAQCHGSDARGSKGFPNLTDSDWLWGGSAETIVASIRDGRRGMMPSMVAAVGGDEGARDVANYVLTLSGRKADSIRAVRGKAAFENACAACHGADGKGNIALGAPNLTDKVWLYGGALEDIVLTIQKGRQGMMPAHNNRLSPEQINLLAAYVLRISSSADVAKVASNP
jgi:cytochrome c oxidase cbb3-type subunit 3